MKQSRLRGSADDLVQERSIAVMGLHRKFNHHTGADAFAGGDIKLAFPLAEDIEPLMYICLLYTSPSPRDGLLSRMPSSA